MKGRTRFHFRLIVWACLLVAVGVAPGATAQELRGQIVGVVTDSSGAALPGVLVTVTGPSLIQPQTTVSGTDGSYRFPPLAPGDYTVVFELDQFQTVRREGVELTLRAVLKIDAALAPAGVSTEVNVVADALVVDVKSTAVGTSFSKELLTSIPTGRDLWSTMALAPGFSMSGVDVGGSHVGSQTRTQSYGVNGYTRTLIEGIISNNSRTSNSAYLDYGSLQEYELGASGAMGEAAGPGSLLNFAVKSGADTFHGSALFNYQNDSMRSLNVPDALATPGARDENGFMAPPDGIGESNSIASAYDLNGDMGGPIWRGKARFYVSLRDNDVLSTVAGLPGLEIESRLSNFTGKVNYSFNARNTLIGYYSWRYKLDSDRGISAAVPRESARNQDGRMHLAKLEWTSMLSNRLFLDLQGGLHYATNFYIPPVESVGPGRQDLVTGQYSGANPSLSDSSDKRPQFTGSLSYSSDATSWGSHFLKVGFQIHKYTGQAGRYSVGDIFYYDRNGVPAEVAIYNTPVYPLDSNRNIGIYAQDEWSVTQRVTLNVGVRYDNYTLGWPALSAVPNQSAYFAPVDTPATTVAKWNSLGARFGLAWDVRGNGRTSLRAFAGRFYIDPSTNVSEGANPVGFAQRRYVFNDLNGNKLLDDGELGRFLSTSGGGGFVRVDPNIKPPYGEELSLHAEHEVFEGASMRVSYVYKNLRDLDAEVDVGLLPTFTTPYTHVDAGPDGVVGTADDQALSLVDRTAGGVSDRMWTNPGSAVGTPENKADYQTVELALNRRLRGRWMLMASFGHTWLKEFIREGARTDVQDFVGNVQDFRWNPNQRHFGRQNSSYWNLKGIGRYETPFWDISASATYRLMSGYNWVRTVSVRFPVAGSTTIPASELSANRAPRISILDLRVDKAIDIGLGKLTFVADVSNLLNAGTVTNFRTGSGSRFKEVIALLPPRALRIGAEWRF